MVNETGRFVSDGRIRHVWIIVWECSPLDRKILLVAASTEEEASRSAHAHWPDLGPPSRITRAGDRLTKSVLLGRAHRRLRVAVIGIPHGEEVTPPEAPVRSQFAEGRLV